MFVIPEPRHPPPTPGNRRMLGYSKALAGTRFGDLYGEFMSSTALVDDSSSKVIYLDSDGELVQVDLHTGEEVKLDPSIEAADTSLTGSYRKVLDKAGNLVYVPKSMSVEALRELQGSRYSFKFSQLLADRVCEEILNGGFITNICKRADMPSYSQFADWRRFYPEVDIAYRNAVRDRAESFIAKAVETVEQALEDKDSISLAKLKSDLYKYISKVGDPDSFGDKQQVTAEVAITGYVVETGIRRPGDPGFNKDEALDVTPKEGEDG